MIRQNRNELLACVSYLCCGPALLAAERKVVAVVTRNVVLCRQVLRCHPHGRLRFDGNGNVGHRAPWQDPIIDKTVNNEAIAAAET